MCKIGDIILIEKYKSNGKKVGKHPFIIIENNGGTVQGIDFNFIAWAMSSFKNERQKNAKMAYIGNFPTAPDDMTYIEDKYKKKGYVKVDQLYFFNTDKINYRVIGHMDEDVLFQIIKPYVNSIKHQGMTFQRIIDNL